MLEDPKSLRDVQQVVNNDCRSLGLHSALDHIVRLSAAYRWLVRSINHFSFAPTKLSVWKSFRVTAKGSLNVTKALYLSLLQLINRCVRFIKCSDRIIGTTCDKLGNEHTKIKFASQVPVS